MIASKITYQENYGGINYAQDRDMVEQQMDVNFIHLNRLTEIYGLANLQIIAAKISDADNIWVATLSSGIYHRAKSIEILYPDFTGLRDYDTFSLEGRKSFRNLFFGCAGKVCDILAGQ